MNEDVFVKQIEKLKSIGNEPNYNEQYYHVMQKIDKTKQRRIPLIVFSKPFAVALASVLLVSSCMSFDYFKSKSIDDYLYSMVTPETSFFSEEFF